MNNIPVRITFKGYEEFGKVVAVPTKKSWCTSNLNEGGVDCVFYDENTDIVCLVTELGVECCKKVFVKYEGKW